MRKEGTGAGAPGRADLSLQRENNIQLQGQKTCYFALSLMNQRRTGLSTAAWAPSPVAAGFNFRSDICN